MKIILDDRRPFSDTDTYRCVRNYEDCVHLLLVFRHISFISLDYDLGEEKTGLDVLKYMTMCGSEVEHINIHSDHAIGVPKMQEFAEEHFPNALITRRPL